MLNIFPELLTYQTIAPFLLRVVLGIIAINLGYLMYTSERSRWVTSLTTLRLSPADTWVTVLAGTHMIAGLLLLVGAWTQIAALACALMFSTAVYFEERDDLFFTRSVVFYILLAVISISLMLTGAGAFAFDIPL